MYSFLPIFYVRLSKREVRSLSINTYIIYIPQLQQSSSPFDLEARYFRFFYIYLLYVHRNNYEETNTHAYHISYSSTHVHRCISTYIRHHHPGRELKSYHNRTRIIIRQGINHLGFTIIYSELKADFSLVSDRRERVRERVIIAARENQVETINQCGRKSS